MLSFQVLDSKYQYIPHNLTVNSNKNITESLSYIQRGDFTFLDNADHSTFSIYNPPSIELYTIFSLQTYFIIFWGILCLQNLSIFIVDKIIVKNIPKNVTLWERITHAIVKSHYPYPYANWHEAIGDCQEHVKRKKEAQQEVLVTSIVNLIFNMVLLFPLVILCKPINYCTYLHTCLISFLSQHMIFGLLQI